MHLTICRLLLIVDHVEDIAIKHQILINPNDGCATEGPPAPFATDCRYLGTSHQENTWMYFNREKKRE